MFRPGFTTAAQWQLKDVLRSRGMQALSYVLAAAYLVVRCVRHDLAMKLLMDANRYGQRPSLDRMVAREKAFLLSENLKHQIEYAGVNRLEMAVKRSIVLKRPVVNGSRIDKGVLLLTFTDTLAFYAHQVDCARLLEYFYVVLEPSWSGYCDPQILFWMRFAKHPIVVQATEPRDRHFIAGLQSNLVPVAFGASDWVDPRLFHPVPGTEKTFDAIYVTNYNPIKRHHAFFKAIRAIGDPTYRAALAFGKWGDSKKDVEALIDYYGVRQNVTLFDGLPQEQVNELLNMSKVNLLLSHKEGSNRSVFEGFFANVPAIVLRNNIGMNKDYINRQTGQLVDESRLAESLLHFREHWATYTPLAWATDNIAPAVTTRKLEACLQQLSRDRSEAWSGGLVAKVNSPEATYFSAKDGAGMPDSGSILSLFLKSNSARADGAQALERGLVDLCHSH
jgi:glycosyltransferase involved in cell wall biosynthesis